MKQYTDTHEWIEIEEDRATVGITSYAQKELGTVVFVRLPEVGTRVQAGGEAAVLESTKAAADIYSPLSGEVIAVNPEVVEVPGLINEFPEDMGWLFTLKLSDPEEKKGLLTEEAYRNLIGK